MMNKKIVLTVEQGELMEHFITNSDKPTILKTHVYGWKEENNKSLNALSIDQMARILYEPNSYEVEKPKFEVGDWVTRIKDSANEKPQFREGKTFKVDEADENIVVSDCTYHNKASLRHATKEEIMWAELGRELNELKFNDTFMLKNGDVYRLITKGQEIEIGKMLSAGDFVGFYPSESFIKLP